MSTFINSIKLNNLTHKVNLLQSDITALEAGTIPPIHGDLDMNNNNVKDVNNLIFIPKENESDYNKIIKKNKSLIDDKFKIIIVNHIREVLDYVLIDKEYQNYKTDITYDKTFDHKKYFNICYSA